MALLDIWNFRTITTKRNVNSIWVPPRNLVIRREYQQIPKTLFVPISQLTRFQWPTAIHEEIQILPGKFHCTDYWKYHFDVTARSKTVPVRVEFRSPGI